MYNNASSIRGRVALFANGPVNLDVAKTDEYRSITKGATCSSLVWARALNESDKLTPGGSSRGGQEQFLLKSKTTKIDEQMT